MNLNPWPRTENWTLSMFNQPKEPTRNHSPGKGDTKYGTDFRHAVEFSRSGRATNPASRPSSSACVVLLGARTRPRGRPRRREEVTWLWLGLSNRVPGDARHLSATPSQQAVHLGRRSARRGGGALDAGHVAPSPPEDEPPTGEPVPLPRHGLGIRDPLVVEVGATLLHGAARLRQARNQAGELHELRDRRDVPVDRDAARLAQRGTERLLAQGGQVVPAEQCTPGGLGLAQLVLPVDQPGEFLCEGALRGTGRGSLDRLGDQPRDLLRRPLGEQWQPGPGIDVVDVEPVLEERVGAGQFGIEPDRRPLRLADLLAVRRGDQRRGQGVGGGAVGPPDEVDARGDVAPLVRPPAL